MTTANPAASPREDLSVERWPTEIPLLLFVALSAAAIWLACVFTIILPIYAVVLGAFFFVAHVVFVTQIRGSGVRIGPDQFPALHERIVELSARAGLPKPPHAYVLQEGGALNALATKFLRTNMIVLFSDLLDACGEDEAARDMIIGHEIGHLRSGHLRFLWFLLPGFFVPFLGSAYSRAREYTCDRWGAALCGDPRGAVRGLAILAAGPSHARRVNLDAFARQRHELDTGWMTLGQWLSTSPVLSKRVSAIEPQLGGEAATTTGPVRAIGILALAALVPMALTGVVMWKLAPVMREAMRAAQAQAQTQAHAQAPAAQAPHLPEAQVAVARTVVDADFEALSSVVNDYRQKHEHLPADVVELYGAWRMAKGAEARAPRDPFDGKYYGYWIDEEGFGLHSAGPDGEAGTDDDISSYYEIVQAIR